MTDRGARIVLKIDADTQRCAESAVIVQIVRPDGSSIATWHVPFALAEGVILHAARIAWYHADNPVR